MYFIFVYISLSLQLYSALVLSFLCCYIPSLQCNGAFSPRRQYHYSCHIPLLHYSLRSTVRFALLAFIYIYLFLTRFHVRLYTIGIYNHPHTSNPIFSPPLSSSLARFITRILLFPLCFILFIFFLPYFNIYFHSIFLIYLGSLTLLHLCIYVWMYVYI